MTLTSSVRVGIIGASGYTGSELARLLATHPNARLTAATASGERIGQTMSDLFPSLRGVCDLELEELNFDAMAEKCDVVVLAMGHGKALDLAAPLLERGLRVIDLGADFRLRDVEQYKEWYHLDHSAPRELAEAVYGLVEWNRDKIREARLVANPGCYPTSAILALSPFIAANAIKAHSIIVDSASGVSGAGRASFGVGTHFPEHFGDFRAYNVTTHRHTPEIEQGLWDAAPNQADPDQKALVTFTAHLLPVARGILSTCYAAPLNTLSAEEAHSILADRYANEKFVRVLPLGQWPFIKAVNGSNFCDIGCSVDKRTGRLLVISAIDNLIKGASGQVVQNLNVMCGFEEDAGLQSAAIFP
ncbi:N-acetyl-gamma-glutamyl-phosphate reductase [Abditibacteriota bacterium]|nr:N-acetyl-gamma-glutamyl-phosphate reductase [Abditibacteriota bacterium]